MTEQRSVLPTVAALLATVGAGLSLGSLFTGGWLAAVVLAPVAVVAGAELARRLGAPRSLVPAAGAFTLLLFLTARFASAHAVAGVLPGPAALRGLGSLVTAGFDDMARYVPPVPPTPGLLLLTALGVGLAALLVDARAVTYGAPGLACVPLLCLFAVPAVLAPAGVSGVGFLLGASAFLVLLHLDRRDRVSGWGRRVRDDAAEGGQAAKGRDPIFPAPGVLAFGVVLPVLIALLIPAAVPALTLGLLPDSSERKNRNRTVHVVNPILDLRDNLLRRENRTLLSYRTSTGEKSYIRVVGLDSFDGERWDASRLQVRQTQQANKGMELPQIGDDVARTSVTTSVQVGQLATQWLPLPFPATRVDIDPSWLYDKDTYNVFSTEHSTRSTSYAVESVDLHPTPEQLRQAPAPRQDMGRFLALPRGVPSAVIRETELVKRKHVAPYDRAIAIRDLLRKFDYSKKAPDGTGNSALARFFASRSGFCVHFASAMAVMARQLGIPARVAVGFTPGRPAGDGSFLVTSHDAHAWPELYFEGAGWVLFEPTPEVPLPPDQPGRSETAEPSAEPSAEASPQETAAEPPPMVEPTTEALPAPPLPPPPPPAKKRWTRWLLAGAGAATFVLLLLTPALIGVRSRRVRQRAFADGPLSHRRVPWPGADGAVRGATAAVGQFEADCLDLGMPWAANETPRQFGERLAALLGSEGAEAAAVRRLTGLAERLRYAPEIGNPAGLAADVLTVRAGLARLASPAVRRRARWFPPSVLPFWRPVTQPRPRPARGGVRTAT